MALKAHTRIIRLAVAGLASLAMVVSGLSGVAQAADPPAPGAPAGPLPTTVTADALPTWQINGVVWSQAIVGNTVYVAGSFTRARPPGVAPGGAGEVVANNIFAYSLSTGNRVASFNHSLNAQSLVVKASADGSRVYFGGDFSTVDGSPRGRIAAFDTASGALVPGFAPNVGGQVRGLGITPSAIYVGGNFMSANGVARTRLAAFAPSNGAMSSWAPAATGGYVWTMAMSPDLTKVVPGGSFTTINGQPAYGMASINTDGSLNPMPAQEKIRAAGANGAITGLKADATQIYGTAYAFGAGASYEGLFALNPDNGQINWANDCLGDTYDIAAAGDVVYNVSHMHDCSVVGAFGDTNPRVRWQKAGANTTYATNITTKNDVYGWNFVGVPYSATLQWFPDFAFGSYTSSRQAGWNVEATGDYVVVGGEFPRVNGTSQQGLTRFTTRANAPKKRGPTYTTVPATPAPATTATAWGNDGVRVTFGAAWDMDDTTLTYEVLRNNGTWLPARMQEADSNFWTLPRLGFVDTGLTPGASYRYQIRAKDPDGNILWSPTSNTVVVGGTPLSDYAKDVIATDPDHYWRLGEAGATGTDYAAFDDVTLSGGYTREVAGAVIGDTDAASRFNGSDAFAVNSTPIEGPNVFTTEAWFRTTSTSGGKIVSFGDQKSGNSNNYDRHVYMSPDGRVWFGVYNNGSYTVNTANALNDGEWHHVVGSLSPDGVTMYVDGRKVGTNAATTVAQPYTGYWRIGGDSAWNGNPYFDGDIDEVAIYPSALTPAQVQQHYRSSGRTLDIPVRPADAYGQAVWDSEPDLYYRLGETAGTIAKDSSPNESNGTYTGGYTQGSPSAVTGTTDTSTTFDGTNGGVYSNQQVNNPRNYTLETWFKTTTTSGGKLIGFGCAQEGGSSCYDRHVYMDNDGKLTFGVWTGFTNTITTSTPYNDGQWHHVVANQSSTQGMRLYLDGALVGTNGQTDAQDYAGYWRVGGDNHWGCCSPYFAGTLDEVAVYSSVLSPGAVSAHFEAGGGLLANQNPTAAFTHTQAFLDLSVDGSTSVDPDGTLASYSWNWGDGTPAGSGVTATHEYAVAGTYTVTLTVTDNRGGTDTEATAVTVVTPPPNQAPTAAFVATKDYLEVAVNGSTSSDPDGTIASYSWNWGDGTPVGSGVNATHEYAAAGSYTVTLTVTDDDDATDTEGQTVEVVANVAPTAAFTSASTNLSVAFDATGSTDPDGTIASYGWNWGDGTAAGTGATPTHGYAAAGTYTVTLTVTDDAGKTDTQSSTVTVTGPPNQLPTAAFTHAENGLTVSVNGNGSTDPDGTIASYTWNWGDASPAVTGVNASHQYASAGTYTVTLTVIDDDGGQNTETAQVTVDTIAEFARDDFGRTVANGWGSADVGGAWSLGGPVARWSVSGGTGRVSLNVGNGYTASLSSAPSDTQEVSTVVTSDKAPTGGGQYVSLIGRRVNATTDYRAKVRFASNGAVAVWLTRMQSGTETTLSSITVPGLNYAANDRIQIREQVYGTSPTTVRVKVWEVGTPEPAAWLLSSTDAAAGLQSAGSIGLYPYLSSSSTNGPVVFGISQLWAGPLRP